MKPRCQAKSSAHKGPLLGFLRQVLLLSVVLLIVRPAVALAQDQLPSPTPDAEGRVIVVVQANDSLWAIAARAGLTIEELLVLNELTENSVIQPGDQLIIAMGTPPATPTSDIPTPTLPPPTATSTPVPVQTAICLLAFDDADRDGVRNSSEVARPGVAFTIFNDEEVIANHISDASNDFFCLRELEAGEYHITRSVAHDEVLSTRGDWAISLGRDHVVELEFGSFINTEATVTPPATPAVSEDEVQQIANDAALPAQELSQAGDAWSLAELFLAFGIFALLLGGGVLLFWVVRNFANKVEG